MLLMTPKQKYEGRNVVSIPLTEKDLSLDTIKSYLPKCIEIHNCNVSAIDFWRKAYRGNQDVMSKTRETVEGATANINNIVCINHAFEAVEFRKGFEHGNPVHYAMRDDAQSTQVQTLQNYMNEQNKAKLNRDLAENFFICGTGYQLCLPKNKKTPKFLQKGDSPFVITNVAPEHCFIAYSTSVYKEPLFGCIVTRIAGATASEEKYQLTCYTSDKIYSYEYNGSLENMIVNNVMALTQEGVSNTVGAIPLIEYPLNNERMGIIEICHTIDMAINAIASGNVDDIQQFINAVLLIYNLEYDADDLEKTKTEGALSLITSDPARPADAKYIAKTLPYQDVQKVVEWLEDLQYSLRGVPRASGVTTSGGDTGQARLLGGGWSRADINTNNNMTAFIGAERELIDVALAIANQSSDSKLKELLPSDIDIKFAINKSDNLLVKTQSASNLYAMKMPLESILNITNLVHDTKETADLWQKGLDEAQSSLPTVPNETILVEEKETANESSQAETP